jgi:polyhydroxyalkanoate synthase subunit PhaC
MAMEGLTLQMCFAGLTPWSNDSPLSRPIKQAIEAETGSPPLDGLWSEQIDPEAFLDTLTRIGQERMATFASGVAAYHAHPTRRDVLTPDIWSDSKGAPILDYGGPKDAPPVLVVPSLINKAYVLDLFEDRSFMRSLAENGLNAFLLDWTADSAFNPNANLTDYIDEILVPALSSLREAYGVPPVLVGYCMGGTLAVAPAAAHPDLVSALVLLAAPWDFHVDSEGLRHWLSLSKPGLDATIDTLGEAPIDLVQALFSGLDPTLVGRKFRSFAAMDPDSESAKRFVILEDWLNDGVPLAGPVARECLIDWYLENSPMAGKWSVGQRSVRPEDVRCPTLAVIPARDRIVPPKSAESLAELIPSAVVQSVALGHIGMMTGSRAGKEVYDPVADWINNVATQ